MLSAVQTAPRVHPAFLRKLRRYTSAQLAANNRYRQLFAASPSWTEWVEEAFGELLRIQRGSELEITLINELHSAQTQTLRFAKDQIIIGRATDSDIALPLQSISRHHARIFERDGAYFIEDLRSVSGTYVNRRKLDPAHSCRLRTGDEILMFPYVLRVMPKGLWSKDETVRVDMVSPPAVLESRDFVASFGAEMCLFRVSVSPEMGEVLLGISYRLVEIILARLLGGKEDGLAASDRGLLEFLAACILEKANQQLKSPFECSLVPLEEGTLAIESGLKLEAQVCLSDGHSIVRLFLPERFLANGPKSETALNPVLASALRWRMPLRIGFVDLAMSDFEQVEVSDIFVYTPRCELLLPTSGHERGPVRGWSVSRSGTVPEQFVIEHFCEWSTAMSAEEKAGEPGVAPATPELSTLSVRVHVVLSYVDMSLQELQNLGTGSILQLSAENPATVQLSVGDKVIGTGELVELEGGHLGVEVTRWQEQ